MEGNDNDSVFETTGPDPHTAWSDLRADVEAKAVMDANPSLNADDWSDVTGDPVEKGYQHEWIDDQDTTNVDDEVDELDNMQTTIEATAGNNKDFKP